MLLQINRSYIKVIIKNLEVQLNIQFMVGHNGIKLLFKNHIIVYLELQKMNWIKIIPYKLVIEHYALIFNKDS